MTTATYDAKRTALLLVDPYNDFLSEGGKVWPRIQQIAEEIGLLANTCIEFTARYAMEPGYHTSRW